MFQCVIYHCKFPGPEHERWAVSQSITIIQFKLVSPNYQMKRLNCGSFAPPWRKNDDSKRKRFRVSGELTILRAVLAFDVLFKGPNQRNTHVEMTDMRIGIAINLVRRSFPRWPTPALISIIENGSCCCNTHSREGFGMRAGWNAIPACHSEHFTIERIESNSKFLPTIRIITV